MSPSTFVEDPIDRFTLPVARGRQSLAATLSANIDTDLQSLVRRHRVCFAAYPIWHVPRDGGRIAIGYELDLTGTHQPQHRPSAGCEECRTLREALVWIARSILRSDARTSRGSIEPFDTAIHFSPRRRRRTKIVLAIDVVHRNGTFETPIDECETLCLQEKLKALGAQPERLRSR